MPLLVDIIVGMVVLLNGISGFRSGFARQVVQVFAMGLGLWLAMRHYLEVAKWIVPYATLPDWGAQAIAWILIWLSTVLVGLVFSGLLDHVLSAVFLGPLNKIAGFFVGMFRGGLILLPVLFLLGFFKVEPYLQSHTGQFLQPLIAAYATPFLGP